ncbi:ABC transporter substrate-binding protein [Alicyclobacillus fastidiosus]|uniref:ABC transporter substrate-binding protein n=1 Tax=Alicyclobacillus fastidiosus TaxID=392011 RepID=A0ABV5AC68_9BACL|nr:ABC transporter substrate-binding protein [Alicyclobacillus fastidiosus]WEH12045.1 ABC transporter substrate-binding protein [Alicyclobacillus fastidiosus]
MDFSGNGLDPESVLSLNPDLIVLYSTYFTNDGKYKQYSKIAPTYEFNQDSGAQGSWRNTLLTLGKILGKSGKAQQLLKDYDQKVSAAKEKLQKQIGKKTVAIIEPSGKRVFLIGKGTFASRYMGIWG